MTRTFAVVFLIQLGLVACGSVDEGPRPDPHAIEGDYWWTGTRVLFTDGSLGPLSKLLSSIVHASTATVAKRGERYVLTIPDCENELTLTPDVATPRVFWVKNRSCSISDAERSTGVVGRTIVSLRLDLDERAMLYHFCTDSWNSSSCGQDQAVFSPLDEAGNEGGAGGEGGAGDAGGTALTTSDYPGHSELVNFADSTFAFQYAAESAITLQCGQVDSSREACETGMYLDVSVDDAATIHNMKGNRIFLLGGFDCHVPRSFGDEHIFKGDPIRCGQSFDEIADVGIPTAWLRRYDQSGGILHIEMEMRGDNYNYYLIIRGTTSPLDQTEE